MNLRLIPALVLGLCSFSLAAPAFAQDFSDPASLPDISVLSADPDCHPDHSVTIHTVMEFQDGLWAWRPVGDWQICVNDGGTSQITVNFKDETYQAIITINGRHVDLAPPADHGWAFAFTRQDLLAGKPSAPSNESSFILDPNHRHRFEMGGHFYSQSRNLRFSVSY